MANGIDPIDDDELLYRRVPMFWYDAESNILDAAAFGPHKTFDDTGLSVVRAKYKTLAEAALGRPGKSYYVAVVRAGDLRQHGIEIVPRPETADGFDPAHAELPDLNAENRKASETLERQQLIVEELCQRVDGPFDMPLNDAPPS